MPDTRVVNALWVSGRLGRMELLTIVSWQAAGYHFKLWSYGLEGFPPSAVELCDAAEIIPKSSVFRYAHFGQSYAGFSDVFRYVLLYGRGGWWTDLDVTVLRDPHEQATHVIAKHYSLAGVFNIAYAPAGCPALGAAAKESEDRVKPDNRDWTLPIRIGLKALAAFNINPAKTNFGRDDWGMLNRLATSGAPIPADWCGIHWCNYMWRTNGMNKQVPVTGSTYAKLLEQFGVA